MYRSRDTFDEAALRTRGEELERLLQRTTCAEQEKQKALMDYLTLLHNDRAASVGIWFSERLFQRVAHAFTAHPTSDLAVDMLYACILVQEFYAMDFAPWRAHPSIASCDPAVTALEADGRYSDCFRFCQETSDTYADARWWPEALQYAMRGHANVKQLLAQGITLLENDELLDLRDSAYVVCQYALHTADGMTDALAATLQADLGAEEFAAVLQEAKDAMDDTIIDPLEQTPEYLAIRYALEEKIDDALEHHRGYYDYCKEYWMAKRLILRSEYGMQWKSPAMLNPGVEFH